LLTAQQFNLEFSVVGTGGNITAIDSDELIITLGQPVAGEDLSGQNTNGSGIWDQYGGSSGAQSYSMLDGWNMVSVPVIVPDYSKTTLYSSAVSRAFAYAGSYETKDTLANGRGYWLRFSGNQGIALVGTVLLTDTITVADKWNMVGVPGVPVAVSSVSSSPPGIVRSPYFGYNSAYFVADTLRPDNAYWVKTSGGGQLVVGGSVNQPVIAMPASHSAELDNMNSILVEPVGQTAPAKSTAIQLFFGKIDKDLGSLEQFELPPVPPSGGFDARFASGRFVDPVSGETGQQREVPILLSGPNASFKLTWTLREQHAPRYLLVEKKGGKDIKRHILNVKGSLLLTPSEGTSYALKLEEIPSAFALRQNYPNPFNPATTIQYDLPKDSRVSLKIYNVLGQEVSTLIDALQEAGTQSTQWIANESASGFYIYRLDATPVDHSQRVVISRKMALVK
jgi:hypothetical protein